MLFVLDPNSPKFMVFEKLNEELLYFLQHSVAGGRFKRSLLSRHAVGQACWDNAKANNAGAKGDLTRDKFHKLFLALKEEAQAVRHQLFVTMQNNQNLNTFFSAPNRSLLSFLSDKSFKALKNLASHLYCSTKDLQGVITAANNKNIGNHFNDFRLINGEVCRACGMEKLAPFRAHVDDEEQWRADYDHQLCKSKYPLYAVHPDNLVPLCRTCNQDAKKAKDLFKCTNGLNRLALNPFTEDAQNFLTVEIENLLDPEPKAILKWNTRNAATLDKLNTWDDVYEIRNRVEGKYISIVNLIQDEINPSDAQELDVGVQSKTRPVNANTLKRKEWAFWERKVFSAINAVDKSAFWAQLEFSNEQGEEGGEYIIQGD